VNASTLFWWRSRLPRCDRSAPKFVPIDIVEAPRSGPVDGRFFEVELLGGRNLCVSPGFDARELARWNAAVERTCWA
jgi:hypothetical protein